VDRLFLLGLLLSKLKKEEILKIMATAINPKRETIASLETVLSTLPNYSSTITLHCSPLLLTKGRAMEAVSLLCYTPSMETLRLLKSPGDQIMCAIILSKWDKEFGGAHVREGFKRPSLYLIHRILSGAAMLQDYTIAPRSPFGVSLDPVNRRQEDVEDRSDDA
jgi:hypothetical protein